MTTNQRYTLHAYVCGPGCVVEPMFEGSQTFTQIFSHRPSGCRYAVVDDPPGAMVWDLMSEELFALNALGLFDPPPPVLQTDTVNAAVMATSLLYGELE